MNNNVSLFPDDYSPTESELYMNPVMLAYFSKKLIDWKERLLNESSNIERSIEEHTARYEL